MAGPKRSTTCVKRGPAVAVAGKDAVRVEGNAKPAARRHEGELVSAGALYRWK